MVNNGLQEDWKGFESLSLNWFIYDHIRPKAALCEEQQPAKSRPSEVSTNLGRFIYHLRGDLEQERTPTHLACAKAAMIRRNHCGARS